jgi:hypothetical protein
MTTEELHSLELELRTIVERIDLDCAPLTGGKK